MNLNLYKVSSQAHIYSWEDNFDKGTKKNILIQLFLSNFLQSICVYFETGTPLGTMSEPDHVVVCPYCARSPYCSMHQTRTLDHIRTPNLGTDSSTDCQSTLGQNKIFFVRYFFLILGTERNNNQNRQLVLKCLKLVVLKFVDHQNARLEFVVMNCQLAFDDSLLLLELHGRSPEPSFSFGSEYMQIPLLPTIGQIKNAGDYKARSRTPSFKHFQLWKKLLTKKLSLKIVLDVTIDVININFMKTLSLVVLFYSVMSSVFVTLVCLLSQYIREFFIVLRNRGLMREFL